jgi:hypothetical protein
MRKLCVYLYVGGLLNAAVAVQSGGTVQTVSAEGSVLTPDIGSVIMAPVRCDSSGNVYLRPPLQKISSEGRRTALFDLSAARRDGLSNLTFHAFAVDSDGTVYQLVRGDQHAAIVKFAGDGRYVGSVILDQELEPLQLAVFKGGAFLVSGLRFVGRDQGVQFAPYIAVFDNSGRQVRAVNGEEPLITPPQIPGSPSAGSTPSGPEFSIAESDGTEVYLLRQGSQPTVFVISPAGLTERTLRLAAPRPDLRVGAFRAGNGRLLVEYVQPKAYPNGNAAYHMVLYDSVTGESLVTFARAQDLPGILACADWRGGFTFLSADADGRPSLVRARLK